MADEKTKDVPKSLIDKLAGTYQSIKDIWFGPGKTPAPVAQEAKGRVFDYAAGFNMNYAPRHSEPISFSDLRGLADNCNLLRLVLERRKSQICAIPWKIKLRQDRTEDGRSVVPDDATKKRIQETTERWMYPDREKPFAHWLRALLEDYFVLDAVCVEPRYNFGGQLIGHDLIDPATITRKIDIYGRTPEPPEIAYQQYLHGSPAVSLTTEEMFYGIGNPRSGKLYGFGPVEQMIILANMALRRDVHKLEYYTEGSMPDVIIGTNPTWSADDIEAAELAFNRMLEGNTASRRKAKFAPTDKVFELKTDILKDQFDEWLARLICFCFGLSPSALVNLVNRATSESIKEDAREETLGAPLLSVQSFINSLLQKYEKQIDLEFVFEQERVIDPMVAAQTDEIAQRNGWKSLDDIRRERGQDPIGVGALIQVPAGVSVMLPEAYAQGVEPAEPEPMFAEDAEAIMTLPNIQEISRRAVAAAARGKKKS